MSMAYASSLDISFEVRGGLLIRQIHHWAALLFVFSMMLHMMRVFFTGAFRKPREVNWIIGVLLLILGMAEGFLGYSLPDDLLSGTGLRAVSAFILSIPVIGTWTHWAVFGGDYPGEIIIPRFYSHAHPADPGHHPGADRRARRAGLVPEAHPVRGAQGDREQRHRPAGAARRSRPRAAASSPSSSASSR